MTMRFATTISMLGLLTLASCGEPSIDLEEWVDQRTENEWMQPGKYVDGAEFFAEGGHYYNHPDDPEATQLDEPYIIPLLNRLREEFDIPQYVILDEEPKMAYAVVMKLPDGRGKRKALEEWLNDEDAKFPGMILQEWGNKWLSLHFLDHEEAAIVREGWGLEPEPSVAPDGPSGDRGVPSALSAS